MERQRKTTERENKRIWDFEDLKRHIIHSFNRNETGIGSIEQLPHELQLGSLGEKARRCRMETDNDAQRRERAALIQYDPSRGSVMVTRDDRIVVGTEDHVRTTYVQREVSNSSDAVMNYFDATTGADFVQDIAKKLEQGMRIDEMRNLGGSIDRYFVTHRIGIIHSHPDESVFSSFDIALFLSDPSFKLSILSTTAGVHVLVPTKETKWLATDSMPSPNKANTLVQEYHDRFSSSLTGMIKKQLNNNEVLTYSFNHDVDFRHRVVFDCARRMLLNACRNRNLGYYVGDHSGTVRRITA
ncbi:MAG TPA: hypothetical protein VJB65_01720 [Patescibacteria group bacterium]|nr:hypothetical protein [Patescibacteria group bacterium]